MSKDISLMFMSENAVGHFEEVCSQVKLLEEVGQGDQAINEFLKASVEIGRLQDHTAIIDRLVDEENKQLYRNYSDSLCKRDIARDKIDSIMHWLENWVDPIKPETNLIDVKSIENFIDIAIPTCLNIASKISHDERRNKLLEKVESIVKQNFVPHSSIPPNHIKPDLKVYCAVLEHLKDGNLNIIREIMTDHSKDLRLNHLLYRTLTDLNIFDNLTPEDLSMETMEFNVCKFNCCNGNLIYANSIAEKLLSRNLSDEVRFSIELMFLKAIDNNDQKVERLFTCAKGLQQSCMKGDIKTELGSKILRQVIRLSDNDSDSREIHLTKCLNLEIQTDKKSSSPLDRWNKLLSNSSIDSQIKTLKIFSKQMVKKFESQPENYSLLNHLMDIDLKLLGKICQSNDTRHKSTGLTCATSVLKNIGEHWSKLDDRIVDTLESQEFFDTTQKIWFELRTNLLSVIAYKRDLADYWKQALIIIVKRLSSLHPNAFIYDILVNRLDLMEKLQLLGDRSSPHECNSTAALLLAGEIDKTSEEQKIFMQDCKRQLDFWNYLSDHLSKSIDDWSAMFIGTERFIREIRRVSYLCGEYLSNLATRIPRDFNNFKNYIKKHYNTSELIDKNRSLVEAKLITICNNHQKAIETLLNYKKVNSLTKYEMWFFDTFSQRLRNIAKEFRSLASQRPTVGSDAIESSFEHIRWELLRCEMDMNNYNHQFRQQYFMELISPLLSRMPPSTIPMPGCHSAYFESRDEPRVTIHKIYQTVQLIASKNSPKKLRFIGSDGITRSFLLKSHDDLRLDQFLMEVFASINTILSTSTTTMKNYQIKQYSVVPVSSRSGLIQWIDAPSLSSSYRSWAAGPVGTNVIKKLYQDTCRNVCYGGNVKEPNPKHECDIPESLSIMHPFRRVLQSKMTNSGSGSSKDKQSKVDLQIRESCVAELMQVMPDQLISNELLHNSPNSYTFWLKTNTFTASWALMCIVGYIIGLGDRHLDNILLDKATGEIIHIDYNICFELGKQLSVPERVPFRLTRNVIHAFGSAGVNGRFILNCCGVLTLLREHKLLLLNLLNPINLSFMVSDRGTGRDAPKKDEIDLTVCRVAKFVDPIPEMPRSQEDETAAMKATDISELGLQLNRALEPHKSPTRPIYKNGQMQVLEHNIKTPTRLSPKTTMNIYKRISEKISGLDYEDEIKKNRLGDKTIKKLKGPRKIEDQVDALIQEATSMQNLAAMYEGWAPWL